MKIKSEEDLLAVVDEVDDVIIGLMERHQMHPMEMIGLILARIVAITREANGEKDILVLLDRMKSTIMNTPKSDVTLH